MRKQPIVWLLALAAFGAAGVADAGPPKRGWAGSDANDHNASNSSWYYRWWHTIPSDGVGSLAEFVPLLKFPTPQNLANNLGHVAGLPDVDTLLVLNEPERESQSNRTVAEALSYWPTIQQTLPNHRLVGPGVGDDPGGRAWLADFMAELDTLNNNANPNDDLRLDAIAFHWYGASEPNPVSAANNFMNRVDWFHQEYGLPVWITEFAMHDWEGNNVTQDMIDANAEFLEIVLPQLDALNYVERYSYYNWFDDAMVFESPDRMPTVIGDQYVGTTLAGEVRDLGGQAIGTDVGYLRGGELTNTGAAIPEAMRAIDALEGLNKISGATDWSLSNRRDNYTRVRSGAVLQKTGANTVELTGILELDGDLEVAEGTLRLAGNAPTGNGGEIRVLGGGTLELAEGRTVFTVTAREFRSSGVVDGAIRFATGTTVTPAGLTPSFTSDVTVLDATLDVGGPGFTVSTATVQPVTTQLQLNYDAALDTPGDNVWDDATGSTDVFTFAGPAAVTSVSDAAFPGLTAAYSIDQVGGANGLNQYFETTGPRSRQDATFEVVFRVDDTAAGTDQVLLEVGGAGRGVAFVLDNDTLKFNVDGDGSDIDLTAVVAEGWNHAIGVIDLTAGGDTVELFVNGQSVGVLTNQTIDDWAGGNLAGLGAGQSSVTGVSSGLGAAYHGPLAVARYYQDYAFDDADALQNYEALTVAVVDPTTVMIGGDFSAQSGSDLRLDVGDDGAADKVDVEGALVVSGGTLSVAHVGAESLEAGDSFDLFDFASAVVDFDDLSLPELDPALRWRLDRLSVDGAIEVVLAGDLNADGVVDAADYTVWRDSLGASVGHFTAGDSNGDGVVDGVDFAEWQANFGATVAGLAVAVPEPSCLVLGALALIVRLKRSRR